MRSLLGITWLVVAAVSACGGRTWTVAWDASPGDRLPSEAEGSVWDAGADSGPDAWEPPEAAPPHRTIEGCDEPVFFLPMPKDVQDQRRSLMRFLGGSWTNLGWELDERRSCALELYDLEGCLVYEVAPEWWDMRPYWGLDLARNGLVLSAIVPGGDWRPNGHDLYFLSFDTWEVVQLTDSPDESDIEPVFNGRYVAWVKVGEDNPSRDQFLGLWLMDIETLEATMIELPEGTPSMYQINDRYVVWNGWGYGGGVSYGRDVFYHDLETGETVHVEQSEEGWVDDVDVGGHWIAWSDSLNSPYPPYRLWVYDIETGEATEVAEEADMFGFGMSGGIVV